MKNKKESKITVEDTITKNKLKILKELKTKTNIKYVEVAYSGSGDSGAIDEVRFLDAHKESIKKKDIPNINIKYDLLTNGYWADSDEASCTKKESNLSEAIDDFCWSVLSHKKGGWEINDGSDGYFTFNVDEGTVVLSHTEFYTESMEYTDEI
jgi:hypothetical protein